MGPGLTIEPERFLRLGRTVVIANPNAQTGIALPVADIERIVAENSGRLVVVDEAYVDFGAESALPLLGKYENLLIVRTYSKSRSLAGARLGFAIGGAELIADLERLKYSVNPYSVSAIGLAAGTAALAEDVTTWKIAASLPRSGKNCTLSCKNAASAARPRGPISCSPCRRRAARRRRSSAPCARGACSCGTSAAAR